MLFAVLLSFNTVILLAQNKLKVGEQARQIEFQKAFTKDYKVPKNKPIILDFWATWCGPCVAGLIETNEFIDLYKDKFEFIAITDTTSVNIDKFIKSRNFKHHFLLDNGKTFQNFGVTDIPHAYIIDKNGIIKWSGNGREVTPELLDKFINTGQTETTSKSHAQPNIPLKRNLAVIPAMGSFDIKLSEERISIPYSRSYSFKPDSVKFKSQLMPIPSIIAALYNNQDKRIIYLSEKDLAKKHVAIEAIVTKTDPEVAKLQIMKTIGERYGFNVTIKEIDTIVYLLKVTDTSKLSLTIMTGKKNNSGAGKYSNSINMDAYLTVMNTTLSELSANIERQLDIFCKTESNDTNGYDILQIEAPDFETFKTNLMNKSGIELVKSKQRLSFLIIE